MEADRRRISKQDGTRESSENVSQNPPREKIEDRKRGQRHEEGKHHLGIHGIACERREDARGSDPEIVSRWVRLVLEYVEFSDSAGELRRIPFERIAGAEEWNTEQKPQQSERQENNALNFRH